MKPEFTSDLLSFPDWKISTEPAIIDELTNGTTVQIIGGHLIDGFRIEHQHDTTEPFFLYITYNPFISKTRHAPGPLGKLYLTGVKLVDGKNEGIIGITVPVEIFAERNDSKELSEAFKCTICERPYLDTENLRKPISLPQCSHTFCKDCINNELIREGAQMPDGVENWITNISCMKCRTSSQIQPARLPCNWNLLQIIEEKRLEKEKMDRCEQYKVVDPFVPCFEDGNHESTVYCKDCRKTFCNRCFTRLHDSRTFGDHKKVPVAEKPIVIPKCPNHPENDAVFICPRTSCPKGKIFCRQCPSHQHRRKDAEILPKLEGNLSEMGHFLKKLDEKLSNDVEMARTATSNNEARTPLAKEHHKQIEEYFEKKKYEAIAKYIDGMGDKILEFYGKKLEAERIIKKTEKMKRNVEKCLKRKENLLEADGLMEEAREVLNKRIRWGDLTFPPDQLEFTPDMSFHPRVPAQYSQRELEEDEGNETNEKEEMQPEREEPVENEVPFIQLE